MGRLVECTVQCCTVGCHHIVQSGLFTPTIISLSLLPESIARTQGIRQTERGIIKYKHRDSDLHTISGNLHKVIQPRTTTSRKK